MRERVAPPPVANTCTRCLPKGARADARSVRIAPVSDRGTTLRRPPVGQLPLRTDASRQPCDAERGRAGEPVRRATVTLKLATPPRTALWWAGASVSVKGACLPGIQVARIAKATPPRAASEASVMARRRRIVDEGSGTTRGTSGLVPPEPVTGVRASCWCTPG